MAYPPLFLISLTYSGNRIGLCQRSIYIFYQLSTRIPTNAPLSSPTAVPRQGERDVGQHPCVMWVLIFKRRCSTITTTNREIVGWGCKCSTSIATSSFQTMLGHVSHCPGDLPPLEAGNVTITTSQTRGKWWAWIGDLVLLSLL